VPKSMREAYERDPRPCTCRTTGAGYGLCMRICDRCMLISPRQRRALNARDALQREASEAYRRIMSEEEE